MLTIPLATEPNLQTGAMNLCERGCYLILAMPVSFLFQASCTFLIRLLYILIITKTLANSHTYTINSFYTD